MFKQPEIDAVKQKNLTFLGEGSSRRVYLTKSGKYVIKFPIDELGFDENQKEAKEREENKSFEKNCLANCRLITLNGRQCLVMEFVKRWTLPSNLLPGWAYQVDSFQVGFTNRGKLVAYDYGFHLA